MLIRLTTYTFKNLLNDEVEYEVYYEHTDFKLDGMGEVIREGRLYTEFLAVQGIIQKYDRNAPLSMNVLRALEQAGFNINKIS